MADYGGSDGSKGTRDIEHVWERGNGFAMEGGKLGESLG